MVKAQVGSWVYTRSLGPLVKARVFRMTKAVELRLNYYFSIPVS